MLDDLLKFYITEGVDKQILKKIPYFLTVALAIYSIFNIFGRKLEINEIFSVIETVSMIVFVSSTVYFLSNVNENLADVFADLDFKKLIGKFSSVYEGESSLLGDINLKKAVPIAISGILNGVSLFILMVGGILLVITYSVVAIQILIAATLFGLVYLVVDVSKSSIVEESEEKSENPLAIDLLEKYAISNSLRRLPRPFKSKSLLYTASRLVGPLFHIEFPKFIYDVMLVYDSPELEDAVRRMTQKGGPVGVYLKHDAGDPLGQLFGDNPRHKITTLLEWSPMKLFPYLLDPNYSDLEKPGSRGWSSFAVLDASADRIVGHVFIHGFRSVLMKTVVKTERERQLPMRNNAYQFLLLGERSHLDFVKTKVDLNSAKVPPEVLRIEYEP